MSFESWCAIERATGMVNRARTEVEQSQNRARTEPEQSQNRARKMGYVSMKLSEAIASTKKYFAREDGGAIVEFVALAIPLFIPIFIYLNSFSSVSANEQIARSMAREVLRVYVISENDAAAQDISGRAAQLLARQWKLSEAEVASLRTRMDCSHFPCLTANGRIKLTLSFIDEETQRKVSASAQEHLSPWL
jgi:hypothetical protein